MNTETMSEILKRMSKVGCGGITGIGQDGGTWSGKVAGTPLNIEFEISGGVATIVDIDAWRIMPDGPIMEIVRKRLGSQFILS
jgi:hypothetical protein